MAEAFGTFASAQRTGSGDSVVKLPSGAAAGLVEATHHGSANFVIETLDASNQQVELLANTIGDYTGTTMFTAGLSGEATKIKITADGAWTLKISPVSSSPLFTGGVAKKGDAVLIYPGTAADLAITNKGTGNFAVKTDDGRGTGDLLVNEIGNYKGTVPVGDGPLLIVVTSDGKWTMKVQQ
jgi:hypothetical protein